MEGEWIKSFSILKNLNANKENHSAAQVKKGPNVTKTANGRERKAIFVEPYFEMRYSVSEQAEQRMNARMHVILSKALKAFGNLCPYAEGPLPSCFQLIW